MNVLRRVAAATGLQRLLERPAVERWVALALRAATVRGSVRFVARELRGRRTIARYRLRSSGRTVFIRHATGDVVTLGEVFDKPDYAPPPPVRALLGAAPRILDLGANIGLFGAYALGLWPEAEVIGYEADADNAAVHRRTLEANPGRWTLVQAAATARDGTLTFVGGGVALSHAAWEGEEGTVEVVACDVLPKLAGADLVKIDIEGGEWAILGDERFPASAPRAVVLEYHPAGAPGPPRVAVEARLREAGYELEPIWHRDDGYGMLWAWRA
jgi:FkbM family methyltransferase